MSALNRASCWEVRSLGKTEYVGYGREKFGGACGRGRGRVCALVLVLCIIAVFWSTLVWAHCLQGKL